MHIIVDNIQFIQDKAENKLLIKQRTVRKILRIEPKS